MKIYIRKGKHKFTGGQINALRNSSADDLADICCVSKRTAEGWKQGRPMSFMAAMLLKRHFEMKGGK